MSGGSSCGIGLVVGVVVVVDVVVVIVVVIVVTVIIVVGYATVCGSRGICSVMRRHGEVSMSENFGTKHIWEPMLFDLLLLSRSSGTRASLVDALPLGIEASKWWVGARLWSTHGAGDWGRGGVCKEC